MIKNILPIGKGSAEGFLMTLEKIFMSKEKSAESAYGQIRNRVKYYAPKVVERKAEKYDDKVRYGGNSRKSGEDFHRKQFRDFDESAKERYLAVVLDYIHRNYQSSKEVA